MKPYIKIASQNGHFLYEVHFINIEVAWLHLYLNFGPEPTSKRTLCTSLQKGSAPFSLKVGHSLLF